mmetsp:Transcript_48223/g.43232  ORF Transcript_48223/g.43232 Transcript_48223/m.43232 type:complete len:232 (-) Transcript_48223:178-873(-)
MAQTNSARLLTKLGPKNLLKHPFYIKWNEGALTRSILQNYAKQYYHHVNNFPKCLSAVHSQSPSTKARQILLENLCEEEFGDNTEPHPKLWLNFANGLNVEQDDVLNVNLADSTKNLNDTFTELSRKSYESGLGCLFAHEHQYSDISKTKKDGLCKHYNINDDKSLEFFTVHSDIDVWHTQQLTEIIDSIQGEGEYDKLEEGALKAADSLWGFLDFMAEEFEKEQKQQIAV